MTSDTTIREFILIVDASERICKYAEEYLTEHEGDDISISVRPWGRLESDVEGLFVRQNGQLYPASLANDEDRGLEKRIEGLLHDAWEHAHELESDDHWYQDDEDELARMSF